MLRAIFTPFNNFSLVPGALVAEEEAYVVLASCVQSTSVAERVSIYRASTALSTY